MGKEAICATRRTAHSGAALSAGGGGGAASTAPAGHTQRHLRRGPAEHSTFSPRTSQRRGLSHRKNAGTAGCRSPGVLVSSQWQQHICRAGASI